MLDLASKFIMNYIKLIIKIYWELQTKQVCVSLLFSSFNKQWLWADSLAQFEQLFEQVFNYLACIIACSIIISMMATYICIVRSGMTRSVSAARSELPGAITACDLAVYVLLIRHRVAITYVIWRIWMHCWARLLPGFRENRRWITSETRSTLACYRQMRTFLLIGLFTRSFDCSTSRYVKRLCAVIQRFGIVGWSTVISVFTNVYVAIITAKCSVPAQHLRTMRTQRPIKWNALAIANTIFSRYATWRLLQWPY